MNEHTVKSFDDDIGQLRALIAQMGGLAEVGLQCAITALVRNDVEMAAKVVMDDKKIDALEGEVDGLAVRIIALRAPMADDLREVVAALKISGIVERIGDYAKNIAKRTSEVEGRNKIEPLTLIPAMAEIAGEMVHDVLDAYAARDPVRAQAVIDTDEKVDNFYNSIFRNLVTHMMENPATISSAAHLLFIAKNIERIGDHATNIAEMVHYAAIGERLPERDKGSRGIGQ